LSYGRFASRILEPSVILRDNAPTLRLRLCETRFALCFLGRIGASVSCLSLMANKCAPGKQRHPRRHTTRSFLEIPFRRPRLITAAARPPCSKWPIPSVPPQIVGDGDCFPD